MKLILSILFLPLSSAFIPLIDGGKGIPKLYEGYFNDQIAKQAASAMSRAITTGNSHETASTYITSSDGP
jgi:hypothetical protein